MRQDWKPSFATAENDLPPGGNLAIVLTGGDTPAQCSPGNRPPPAGLEPEKPAVLVALYHHCKLVLLHRDIAWQKTPDADLVGSSGLEPLTSTVSRWSYDPGHSRTQLRMLRGFPDVRSRTA